MGGRAKGAVPQVLPPVVVAIGLVPPGAYFVIEKACTMPHVAQLPGVVRTPAE